MRRIGFAELRTADLVVDATYESDVTRANVGSEPLGPLKGTGNQGGFRFSGPVKSQIWWYSKPPSANRIGLTLLDEENGLRTCFGHN